MTTGLYGLEWIGSAIFDLGSSYDLGSTCDWDCETPVAIPNGSIGSYLVGTGDLSIDYNFHEIKFGSPGRYVVRMESEVEIRKNYQDGFNHTYINLLLHEHLMDF